MRTQLKFVVDRALADRFKRVVLEKHGKLNLSREGEEALRLYLREVEGRASAPGRDPLLSVIGIARSTTATRPDARRDKRRLYEDGAP